MTKHQACDHRPLHAVAQRVEWEAVDLAQKLDEAPGRMVDQSGAPAGIGVRGVAAGAEQVEVLDLPAESDLALRGQMFEFLRHLDAETVEFAPFSLSHLIGAQVEHHGRLDAAAMDAMF